MRNTEVKRKAKVVLNLFWRGKKFICGNKQKKLLRLIIIDFQRWSIKMKLTFIDIQNINSFFKYLIQGKIQAF